MPLVPSGISVSATNPNGGPATCPIAPGLYSMTGSGATTGLVTALQTSLNANNADGWKVTLSTSATDGLNATGQVTLDNSRAGARLTKTGGTGGVFDAGASSVQSISGDGFVEIRVAALGQDYFFALATTDPNADFPSMDYAFHLNGSTLQVYRFGSAVWTTGVTYAVGDALRINRTGTAVTFLLNGVVQYTSPNASTGSLFVDTSIATASAAIGGIRLYDATNGYQSLTWHNITNVSTATDTFSVDWSSSGDLRSILGFATQPTSGAYPQVGAYFCDGLFFPDSPVIMDGDPREFPMLSDRRSQESPTGVMGTIVGSVKYQHENLKWQAVPQNRYREQAAYLTRCSWENFVKVTQLGQGGYAWFQPGAPILIYDHTNQLVGSDGNGGIGPSYGWTVPDLSRVRAVRLDKQGWNGRWTITLPRLVSAG